MFVHPISLVAAYIDDQPTRKPVFALAPNPDTIGKFLSQEEATKWCEARELAVVDETLFEALPSLLLGGG